MKFYKKKISRKLLLNFVDRDNALVGGWLIVHVVSKDGHICCEIWTVQIVNDCLNAILLDLSAVQKGNGRWRLE